MVKSIIFWLFTCIITLIYALFMFLSVLLFIKSKEKVTIFFRRLWGKTLVFMSGSKLEVKGLKNLNKEGTYIFMANHQSMFDIFALCTMPFYFLWFAKHNLFKIPIFGLALKIVGSVPVNRTSLKKSYKSFKTAEEMIKKNKSLLFFPEGTRSTDSKMLPFKKGGFRIAIDTGKSIVPMSISGSGKIQSRGEFRIFPGKIKLIISPPISTDYYSLKKKDELANRVKEVIEENLNTSI